MAGHVGCVGREVKEDWEEQEKVSGWSCRGCGKGDEGGLGGVGEGEWLVM